jgi:hypothetical protein
VTERSGVPGAGAIVVSIHDLLYVTGCSDIGQLSDQVYDDSDVDTWVDSCAEGVEVRTAACAIRHSVSVHHGRIPRRPRRGRSRLPAAMCRLTARAASSGLARTFCHRSAVPSWGGPDLRSDMAESLGAQAGRVCPRCGREDSVPLLYGLPGPDDLRLAERGEVALGGCLVAGKEAAFVCRTCHVRWGDESDATSDQQPSAGQREDFGRQAASTTVDGERDAGE